MKKTYTKKQITEAIAYWKNQLKKLNEDANNIALVLPKEPTTDAERGALFDLIDKALGGEHGLYLDYIDGNTAEISIQRDVDDFDEYRVPYEELLSEDEFWEGVLNMLYSDYQEGQEISYDELTDVCNSVFDDAADQYIPSRAHMTHAGRMRWGGRYPGIS